MDEINEWIVDTFGIHPEFFWAGVALTFFIGVFIVTAVFLLAEHSV